MATRTRLYRTRWEGTKLEARLGVSRKAANRAQRYTKEEIVRSGRVRTGRMVKSVYVRPTRGIGKERTTYAVGSSLDYFTYQNQGFGPIVAKRAKALKITLRNGVVLFRKRTTRPVAPGHFLQKAIRRLRATPLP